MRASSRLLLLVGLLALWAELAPVSGQVTPPVRSDRCQLPMETGPCKVWVERYYYSPSQKKCLQFIYGGCRGNSNNFETQKACEEACGKISPATRGTCPSLLVPPGDEMPGDFCSTDDSCPGDELCCKTKQGQQCALPVGVYWGRCPKDPTKPGQATICLAECSTDEDCVSLHLPRKKCCTFGCRRTCAEAQEDHPGVCLKRKVVQTFAPCNNTCKDDGDCPLTQKCCFTGCSRGCLDPVRSDRCQLPKKTGPCKQRLERYYYSPSQKKCLQFTYGGCQGNSNNFETQKACEEVCGKISPEVCKLPSDSGPCLGLAEMYYFNSTTKTCDTFIYGLCKGNGNRFSTKLECLLVCGNPAKSPAQ